jgi:hypothetical protein
MVSVLVKIVIGLFIWVVLPRLIYSKRKYQKNSPQFFVHISCKIIGIAIIAFAILNFLQSILK